MKQLQAGSDVLDALPSFIEQWQRLTASGELADFLAELSAVLPATEQPKPEPNDAPSIQTLQVFIDCLRKPINDAFESGEFCNIWTVSGVGRDELRNAAILAWLFDRYGSHGQRDGFLKHFLYRLKEQLPPSFPGEGWTESHYVVRREIYPLGVNDNRVDVEIESPKCLVLIETKVDAGEGKEQLARYQTIADAKARGRPWALLFLCISHERAITSDRTVRVTWNDVATAIKERIRSSSRATHELDYGLAFSLEQLAQFWKDMG